MIGYYAHHHGVGHLTRATSIAQHLDEPVVMLTSRAEPATHSFSDWVSLPMDTDTSDRPTDPTANGTVHWAPLGSEGLRDRMGTIARWVTTERPRLVVVDVSVEVALLVRLLGTPVAVAAMPGTRTDSAHTLAYRAATMIIAPWSQRVYRPSWLSPFDHKVTYTGSISRFEGRERLPRSERTTPRILVLGGAGGSALAPDDIDACRAANPEFDWVSAGIGPNNWCDDVWPLLCDADVVVTHAGQNAIADVAAARTAAVVVAQQRPFDEQQATAQALSDNDIAVEVSRWPRPYQWADLLSAASTRSPDGWSALRVDGAGARAAAAVSSVLLPSADLP
ncbi:glycosyltransferase [Actinomycetes bacterium M1A6_2h]